MGLSLLGYLAGFAVRLSGLLDEDFVGRLVIVANILVVEGSGDDADKFVGDVVGEEVAEIHDGSVILSGEPRFLLALALTPDVSGVASWDFLSSAKVLPKSVFEEGLRESDFDETSVGTDWEGFE